MAVDTLEADIKRKVKKAKYDLTKKIYSDPVLLEMEYLRAQKKVWTRSVNNLHIHNMDGSDPFTSQLNGFVDTALTKHEVKK